MYITYVCVCVCVQKKIAQVATDAATAAASTRDLHAEIMCRLCACVCVCVFLPISSVSRVIYYYYT